MDKRFQPKTLGAQESELSPLNIIEGKRLPSYAEIVNLGYEKARETAEGKKVRLALQDNGDGTATMLLEDSDRKHVSIVVERAKLQELLNFLEGKGKPEVPAKPNPRDLDLDKQRTYRLWYGYTGGKINKAFRWALYGNAHDTSRLLEVVDKAASTIQAPREIVYIGLTDRNIKSEPHQLPEEIGGDFNAIELIEALRNFLNSKQESLG